MRQKDKVGNTPQKENQAHWKGTWQERSRSAPAPAAGSLLYTRAGQTVFGMEQNRFQSKAQAPVQAVSLLQI